MNTKLIMPITQPKAIPMVVGPKINVINALISQKNPASKLGSIVSLSMAKMLKMIDNAHINK
jgi:hypothetical protein